MQVKEIMTRYAEGVQGSDMVVEAAAKMRELNVGCLPVYDGDTPSGIITDRDITVRAVALGLEPGTTEVQEVMTGEVVTCAEDTTLVEAAETMEQRKVRRLLVTEPGGGVVGIISLGDIAAHGSEEVSGEVLQHISQPAAPAR